MKVAKKLFYFILIQMLCVSCFFQDNHDNEGYPHIYCAYHSSGYEVLKIIDDEYEEAIDSIWWVGDVQFEDTMIHTLESRIEATKKYTPTFGKLRKELPQCYYDIFQVYTADKKYHILAMDRCNKLFHEFIFNLQVDSSCIPNRGFHDHYFLYPGRVIQ